MEKRLDRKALITELINLEKLTPVTRGVAISWVLSIPVFHTTEFSFEVINSRVLILKTTTLYVKFSDHSEVRIWDLVSMADVNMNMNHGAYEKEWRFNELTPDVRKTFCYEQKKETWET